MKSVCVLVSFYLKRTVSGLNVANGAVMASNPAEQIIKPKQQLAFPLLTLYPLNRPVRWCGHLLFCFLSRGNIFCVKLNFLLDCKSSCQRGDRSAASCFCLC